ncbi:MAG TPA: deoxynucleoside kinase [Solirubrobacterales bacterium]|nr:deoxynucleoside kinase [Solirubrobacterales bacterium]
MDVTSAPVSGLASRFIVVSGNIGAGKSTLVKSLAEALGSVGVLERHTKNPYLQSFYESPARWAFHAQAGFLRLSIEDYERVCAAGGAVLERTLEEHHDVFARELHDSGMLSDQEFEILERLQRSVSLPRPDLLIYLHAPPRTLAERIALRDRAGESNVSLEYLTGLGRRYEEFAARWDASPLVPVDTVELDFRRDDGLTEVIDRCISAVAGKERQ